MTTKLTRRTLLAAGAAGLAAATHAGGAGAQTATGAFNWRRFAGTTLRCSTIRFPLSEIQQRRLAEFERLSGIKVEWEALPEDVVRQKIKVSHLGGSTDMDVFISYFAQEGQQFMSSGWYVDTAPMMRDASLTNPDFAWDDFIPTVRGGATVDGKVPIIPDRAQSLPILYYRRDLFQQFNLQPPKTWDEVREAARIINEGTRKQVFGIVLRGKGAAATSMFGPVLYDFGGRWADRQSGNITIDTPQALAAFQWWGSILRDYGPPGSVNNHWAEVTSIFSQGRAAMVFDDITFATTFSDPSKSTVAGRVGYAPAPLGPRSAAWRNEPLLAPNVTGLAISGLGRNKEAAWFLVQYLSDKVSSRQYMLAGGLGARQSSWTDPEVARILDPEFLATGRISTQINSPGAAPHSIANVSKARDFLGEVVVASILGQDVRRALSTAQQRVAELLAEERARK